MKWKPKKFQRQGFSTSIKELRAIAKELEKESKAELKHLRLKRTKKEIDEQKWQLNIINTEGASDTWRFEMIT